MKEQDIHHIWKYLDNEATPSERGQLQKRATDDAAFNAELQTRQQLNHALQQMETEQPSMRFMMNVMDKLPQLYKKIVIKPLINPRWIKGFLYTLSILAFAYAGAVVQYMQSAEKTTSISLPGVEAVGNALAGLPTQVWVMLGILCFSYLFFVILDRQLKKRFAKKS